MASRICESINQQVKQNIDSQFIRWCINNPDEYPFMPIIAKGNMFAGIEARE